MIIKLKLNHNSVWRSQPSDGALLMTLTKEIAGHTCGVSLSVDEVDRWALWVDIHGDGNNIELETFDTKEEVSE